MYNIFSIKYHFLELSKRMSKLMRVCLLSKPLVFSMDKCGFDGPEGLAPDFPVPPLLSLAQRPRHPNVPVTIKLDDSSSWPLPYFCGWAESVLFFNIWVGSRRRRWRLRGGRPPRDLGRDSGEPQGSSRGPEPLPRVPRKTVTPSSVGHFFFFVFGVVHG